MLSMLSLNSKKLCFTSSFMMASLEHVLKPLTIIRVRTRPVMGDLRMIEVIAIASHQSFLINS